MLTNREIATIILLGGFLIWTLAQPSVRKSLPDLYRSVTNPKVMGVIGVYLAYALLLIGSAQHFGFWDVGLLKDTVIVVAFTGMGMVMSANAIKSGAALTKKTVGGVIGLTALIAFYVNLSSFPILIEVLIQGFLAVIAMLSVVSKYQKDISKSIARFFDALLFIGGICLLVKTTTDIQEVWSREGAEGVLSPLLLSIWFPLMLLPFVYALSFVMYLESILLGLRALNNQKHIGTKAFFALLVGLRFSLKHARCFTGRWRMKFLEMHGFKDRLSVIAAYRKDTQKREAEERAAVRRLKQYAGVDGKDEHGKRLDRREFKETCRLLIDLYFYQRGMRVNRGKYFDQPLILLNDSKYYGLGENRDLAVAAFVKKDKSAWYAWRRTVTGWVFAIGGAKDPNERWQYDGSEPPSTYPSANNPHWKKDESTNWE